jgi:hypothetical protein
MCPLRQFFYGQGRLKVGKDKRPYQGRPMPTNPAYVQYLYDYALINDRGMEVLGVNKEGASFPGIDIERDAQGNRQVAGKYWLVLRPIRQDQRIECGRSQRQPGDIFWSAEQLRRHRDR